MREDYDQIFSLLTLRGRSHQESKGQMSVLFLLPDRGPSDVTSHPHMLLWDIILTPDINIDSRFHPDILIGHTRILLSHGQAMLLGS